MNHQFSAADIAEQAAALAYFNSLRPQAQAQAQARAPAQVRAPVQAQVQARAPAREREPTDKEVDDMLDRAIAERRAAREAAKPNSMSRFMEKLNTIVHQFQAHMRQYARSLGYQVKKAQNPADEAQAIAAIRSAWTDYYAADALKYAAQCAAVLKAALVHAHLFSVDSAAAKLDQRFQARFLQEMYDIRVLHAELDRIRDYEVNDMAACLATRPVNLNALEAIKTIRYGAWPRS
jgi:small-conductance mechanosensitive channel